MIVKLVICSVKVHVLARVQDSGLETFVCLDLLDQCDMDSDLDATSLTRGPAFSGEAFAWVVVSSRKTGTLWQVDLQASSQAVSQDSPLW